jgi:Holliday junction resolvase-like predicted endonuclease
LIAEIYNKISKSGSNLSDRLEDQLTGDFFGTIRYLPFQTGLRHVLEAVRLQHAEQDSRWEKLLASTTEYDYEMKFWFRHAEGEIDLIVDLPDAVIGIEVKYYSGLSSEDEDLEGAITPEESVNQLARYSRLLQDIRQERPAYLLFVAPFQILLPVEIDMKERSIISPDITLGFLAWQHILEQLQMIPRTTLETGQQRILEDLMDLLVKKGFERFKGFVPGVQQSAISQYAYSFNAKSHSQLNIVWPTSTIIQEDNYVYNKKSR